MRSLIFFAIQSIILPLLLACTSIHADSMDRLEPATHIRLPKIFGSYMVLQQDHDIAVWGTADPGGRVTVVLDRHVVHARVSKDSTWHMTLPPMKAGGPYQMHILGSDTTLFNNVLVGEVWICSGQSNMEWPLINSENGSEEIANADYPDIRIFTVWHNTAFQPLDTLGTYGWMPVNSPNIRHFSAVGYFFGRDIHENVKVPVGLIHTSWGGTPADAWTSLPAIRKQKGFDKFLENLKKREIENFVSDSADTFASWEEQIQNWREKVTELDMGLNSSAKPWYEIQIETDDWLMMDIPTPWETGGLPGYNGVVWFRKEVELTESDINKSWILHLGALDDIDFTWLNGEFLGSETFFDIYRQYAIPENRLKPGRNVIAVRILDFSGTGGFWGMQDEIKLISALGDSIPLTGEWRYKVGVDMKGAPSSLALPRQLQQLPTVLFNGMVSPIIPYTMRGVIWYQGEDNVDRAYQYRRLFPGMIQDWRTHWGQGDFPFIFVQLANYMTAARYPGDSDWAELREAQLMTLSEPNTGMAVAIDIGEAGDIHPRNKRDVGRRLALYARARAYGEDVVYSGPLFQKMQTENGQIRLIFQHTGAGLMAKGGELKGFAIAGENRKFVWADAMIEGNTVVVSSPRIPHPVAVRYGWANNPVCNLYNREGLPASPFRTDSWPGITKNVVF